MTDTFVRILFTNFHGPGADPAYKQLEKQLSLCRAIVGVPADVRIHQRERESTTVSSLTFPGFCFSNNCGESETTLVRKNETFSGNLTKLSF